MGCENLESVACDSFIGKFAFLDCKSLRKINFPKTLSIIGDRAFKGCAFEELEIPKHITTIGKYAFLACSKLAYAKVCSNCIGEYAFSGCENLKTLIIDSTTVSRARFSNCISLESLTLSDNVAVLGAHAFANNKALKKVVLLTR